MNSDDSLKGILLEPNLNDISRLNRKYSDVAAIVTAMTDGEKPFLYLTLKAILSDSCIDQVILCIEEENNWLNETISPLSNDSRLQILRLPLMPQGAVRNKALAYVQKPWVAYCDGDDIWCNEKISLQRDLAEKESCDFVGSDHCLTDEKGRVRAFAFALYLPMLSSWMVRTEIMRKYPFNESREYLGIEDGEWWVRTANVVQKIRCPKMLLRYRVRSSSSSSSSTSKKRKAAIVSVAKIPIIGFSIFLISYFIWLFTRQEQYMWLNSWNDWQTTH